MAYDAKFERNTVRRLEVADTVPQAVEAGAAVAPFAKLNTLDSVTNLPAVLKGASAPAAAGFSVRAQSKGDAEPIVNGESIAVGAFAGLIGNMLGMLGAGASGLALIPWVLIPAFLTVAGIALYRMFRNKRTN